ncbi:MAG: electron transfer flavoprotein subunit beta/FixA family protein [Acidimicrobiia bacterium]|nr:electron transfer flavoprotein subunit beta/FixA family protein [Acidimicrobiia bacterium]
MRVLVCVKRVPAPGAKILIAPDGRSLDTAHLGFTVSPHEECAMEEAVQIVERHGGTATVLTLGPAEAEEQLRYGVSIGIESAVLIKTDGSDWDPQRTASAITDAVTALEARDGAFDLILFGNESADSGGYQVGVRVAHALARPMVNGIKGIEPGDGSVTARRAVDAGFEVYQVPTPAVLGVKEGINLPRYPTLKGRLNSKKVEVEIIESSAEPGHQAMVRLLPPKEQVTETTVLGRGPEAAAAVVDLLEELGVLA